MTPALLLATVLSAATAQAQSAQAVLETMYQEYEAGVANIDNYTLVEDISGHEIVTYMEKTVVDGRPVFRTPEGEGERTAGDVMWRLDSYADHARLDGRETVEQRQCYVVVFEDIAALALEEGLESGQGDFRPTTGTFYIDTDDYLVRKMVLEGEYEHQGATHTSTMVALLQDYRDVGGLSYPFRTVMTVQGLPTGDMSEEDLEEARRSMEEMKQQMAEMPESQRAMMERMMKPQMERLEQMLQGGALEFVTVVKDLKVNAGPP
jgi:hypothetical protein